jgi:transcriptional regulator with XRE-family HTH domain
MSFSHRLTTLRKDHKLSQGDLAIKVGIHANLIGRYERGEAIPSVEVAAKIAAELATSLDYLIGLSELKIDTDLLNRVKEITSLTDDDRRQLYAVVDALLRDYRAKGKK